MTTGLLLVLLSLAAPAPADGAAGPADALESALPPGAEIHTHPELRKPTDICRFQGRYVATELMTNQLASFSDLATTDVVHFVPQVIGEALRNPHFLAPTERGTLLISSGWGTSIVEIRDLDGADWKEFHGLGDRFHAPHGVCVDGEGWIYVGDSLNSRLVRFRDMEGAAWSVFGDKAKRVAYNRQLIYKHGALWASNSYENREGLNEGEGGNILRITDWESGESEVVYSIRDSNVTGVLPGEEAMYVGIWGAYRAVMWVDLETGASEMVPGSKNRLGVPYGMFEDPQTGQAIVTYFGDLEEQGNPGGLLTLPHPDRYTPPGRTEGS